MGQIEIGQLRNREEAILYYASALKNGVLLENAFAISISTTPERVGSLVLPVGLGNSLNKIHVVGLTVPALGMSVSNSDLLGYVDLKPNNDVLVFNYSVPVTGTRIIDPFLDLFKNSKSVSSAGAPLFIPVSKRPTVQLLITKEALFSDSDYVLAEFTGCMFSYPRISANLSGTGASVFSVTVAYYDCKVN